MSRKVRRCHPECGQLEARALERYAVAQQVAIEIRAAELAQLGREERFEEMTRNEFDWYVHGEWPAHCPTISDPESDEDWAAWLAHCIEDDETFGDIDVE